MNKRKKITQILVKKSKRANAKNIISNKPRYISKADREQRPADTELASTE